MGAGPKFPPSTYRTHPHRTGRPTRGHPVQLLKDPSLPFNWSFHLVFNLSPPRVFQTPPSPNPNSPFLLPLPSLPCKFLPPVPLGRRRAEACLIAVLILCSCVDWRKQSAESLEERQNKSDSVPPHEDPFSTCPSWHTMTCRRMSPCLHHSMPPPSPIRMAGLRSPGALSHPKERQAYGVPTPSIGILGTFLLFTPTPTPARVTSFPL